MVKLFCAKLSTLPRDLGGRGIASCNLHLGARFGNVVGFMPQPFCALENGPSSHSMAG